MKVIATDFDNTFYVKDMEILERNIEAARKFVEKGNIFIIITGRSYINIKKEIDRYNIPYSFIIIRDGANILDSNDECIISNPLDQEKAKVISNYLDTTKYAYFYESIYEDADKIENVTKITVEVENLEQAEAANIEIKKLADVYSYVSTKHINVIDSYVNKSNGLKYLRDNKYIDEDISVIGDDINDYEMLSDFDGVVMKKHHEILDPLNKEEIENVYEYIERFI